MRFLLLIIVVCTVSACSNESKPDLSNIKIDASIQRFDKDFFSIDTTQMNQSIDGLYKKYPAFLPAYFEFFSPVNFIIATQGRSLPQALREYYNNIKPLYDSVQKKYSSVSDIESGLRTNLAYVKYYYPSFKTPVILTSVESLNPTNKDEIYGALYFRDTLVISLQMFLGKDFSAYDPSQYFDYIRRRFEPGYIVPNAIRSISAAVYPDSSQDAPLIEQFIEKGKQWYQLSKFMPGTHDSLITLFTNRQLGWCKENEGQIWASVLSATPDLYTVDAERLQNYIGEAPFTQNMETTNSSPGNIGQWVGWQIVKAYASKNPSFTLQQLLATPARKIFQEAKYKPK